MKNGLATNLAVTISDLLTAGNNTGDVIEFDDFDDITLRCVPSSTPTVTTAKWGIKVKSIFPFPNSLMMGSHGR